MEFFQSALKDLKNIPDEIWGSPEGLHGVARGSLSLVLHEMFHKPLLGHPPETPLIAVFPDDQTAEKVYEELLFSGEQGSLLPVDGLGRNQVLYFPSWRSLPLTGSIPDLQRQSQRSKTLYRIGTTEGEPLLVVTSVEAIQYKIPDRHYYQKVSIQVNAGKEVGFDNLIRYLDFNGYERTDLVNSHGYYSVKGGIIDIFTPAYDNPIRIDFWGDEVEKISFFDPDTQISYDEADQVILFPRYDIVLHQEEKEVITTLLESAKIDPEEYPLFLRNNGSAAGVWDYYPFALKTIDFMEFTGNCRVCAWEAEKGARRLNAALEEFDFLAGKFPSGVKEQGNFSHEKYLINSPRLEQIYKDSFSLSVIAEGRNIRHAGYFDADSFNGRISTFIESVLNGRYGDKKVFVSVQTEPQLERLNHILAGHEGAESAVELFIAPFSQGFSWDSGVLFTEKEVFGKTTRQSKIGKSSTRPIDTFTDLQYGDYVVHVNYGIGKFIALKRMKVADFERDFIELEFAGSDKLYVPLDQLGFVHKYIGSTDHPKLDYLGGKSTWEKTRQKVSEHVEKMAMELLELYAERENARGIAYPADTTFQEIFEASFPYEETEHQILAIQEVKKDMESDRPMDRLVCGDVGFGKTEVAIRAAFKAVMAGRQVAILCPTTVLTFQHYNTFKKRFADYPVRIDYISRFKTTAEANEVRQKLKTGDIDIVIGTHALLNEKIEWHKLGLLVIDEEQRFGVKNKEQIKQLRSNIDSISMTATPIPRTLQMSLIGIRDLSIIETPPRERKKIETFLLEDSDEIIKQAINHELERHGQVFILHNKVKTIFALSDRIRQLVPEAKIAVLHGQMTEHEIEQNMIEFYERKYDILVSTTIIESGIDIPNANTLLVLNSHTFGLSQLYQIKGRVGRSERQGYAYFFYPHGTPVNEIAQKRLNTLIEYDGLGDGFKIAMKDLEIRGAGNLLGKEQSGTIMAVGFDLYVTMLQNKIHELRNEKKEEAFEAVVIVPQDFYFPDSFISDVRQKMEYYKKLVSAETVAVIDHIEIELKDRFGKVPEVVQGMIEQQKLKTLAELLHIEKVAVTPGEISFWVGPGMQGSFDKMLALIQKDPRFSLDNTDLRKVIFSSHSTGVFGQMRELNGIMLYLLG